MGKTKSAMQTLLASQPIYSREKDLFGFELLFRHEADLSANDVGEDLATSEVLLNLATGVTEQVDLYSRPMFINLSESFLFSDTLLPVLSKQVIIELPATVQVNDQVINAVKHWRKADFRFALDGFDFSPRYEPLLGLVDYVKVDTLDEPLQTAMSQMPNYAAYPFTWIAERVETEELFNNYAALGFSLFQGYFLAKPLPIQGYSLRRKISSSVATIDAVSQPDIEVTELAKVVSKDPNLATQILKIINSPACALRRNIESLKDAIVYLGLAQVRKWAIMMSMMNNTETNSGTIRLVLTRAKACENYAAEENYANPDKAFLVGLLSGINLLFGIENSVFLAQVSLHPDIKSAILTHQDFLGKVLMDVLKAEHSIMQIRAAVVSYDMTILAAYLEANEWVEKVLSSTTS